MGQTFLGNAAADITGIPRKSHSADRGTARLDETLENAEHLLNYAADAGIDVDPAVAQTILAGRRGGNAVWDGPQAGVVLAAITKLAAKVHPVTGETLRTSQNKARTQIKFYTGLAVALAAIIVMLSTLSFVTTEISHSIDTDIAAANALTVTLHSEPASTGSAWAAGVLPDLQRLTTLMRSIDDESRLLSKAPHWLGRDADPKPKYDPRDLELAPNLTNRTAQELINATVAKTQSYQQVRLYAGEIQANVGVFYRALGACVLPVFYAMLGACAYLLRLFSVELNMRTFSRSYAISARFSIAVIGGLIVGLFNDYTKGFSLPPLAIAFLVGYAADVFFAFLESLLQNFGKIKS